MSGELDLQDDRVLTKEQRDWKAYLVTMTKDRLADLVIQYDDMLRWHLNME